MLLKSMLYKLQIGGGGEVEEEVIWTKSFSVSSWQAFCAEDFYIHVFEGLFEDQVDHPSAEVAFLGFFFRMVDDFLEAGFEQHLVSFR